MATRQEKHETQDGALTRRRFLSTSCLAASALGVGLPTRPLWAQGTSASPTIDRIDPGYIGPQFFDEHERQALMDVVDSGSPFRYWGPGTPTKVLRFEEGFAKHMGTQFALGVTSGTAALDCAVAGLDIGPGDEVIVPAYTWWSDYTCVVHAGALPVFADIDRTLNIDPKDFERKITPRTKAVIAVHLLGGPCDMEPSDPILYERAARFHDMGGLNGLFAQRTGASRVPTFAGENFRMNELTGAVLGAQLPKLDTMVAALRSHAEAVYDGIKGIDGIRLRHRPDPEGDIGYSVFFEMPDKAARDRCIDQLRQRHVPTSTMSGSVLLPIAESVINKRARHPNWPSFNSPEGKAIQYGPDCCRQTLGIYDRFVQVRIGPKYTQRIDDYIIDAIRQVHSTAT